MTVLNPTLYYRLRELYDRVYIGRQGESPIIEYFRGKMRVTHGGEAYRINCPFCGQVDNPDTRQRLWISHVWGYAHPKLGGRECLYELYCYNNGCFDDPYRGWDNIRRLKTEVFTDAIFGQRQSKMQVFEGEPAKPVPEETTYPGECLPLDELKPDHPAITYLVGRKFDPAYLTREFGVRYCLRTTEEYPACLGRLIIPIIMDGKMRTWQARYIGTPPKGVGKYINQKGASKTQMLYGHDAALAAPFVTLTEGVTNVWRLGSGAVATLGKYVSLPQFTLLSKWRGAVLALDPDAYFSSEDTFRKLTKMMPTVRVLMPEGQDPDSMGVDAFWRLVAEEEYKQRVRLPS